jgi:hypothetical protein
MDLSLSTRAIKDLISFPFHDPEWKSKFLMGIGVTFAGTFFPIVPWLAVWGYIARVLRAGAANEDAAHLPVWDEWGEMLMDGLRQFGVAMIFLLPSVVISVFGWVLYMVGVMSFSFSANNQSEMGARGAFMFVSMIIFFTSIGLGTLLSVAAWLVMPAAQAHAAVQRRFSAAFEVRDWWRIFRANLSGFLLAGVLFFVLEITLMLVFQFFYVTVCLCPIGLLALFPGAFYIFLLVYRLVGQAYGEGLAKVGAPAAPPAEPLAAE